MNTNNCFVFLVIFLMSLTEIFCVNILTSAKIGILPVLTIHDAEEKKLLAVTIISEFLFKFKDLIATSSAAVPLQIAIEYLFPIDREKFFSNFFKMVQLYN